MTKPSLSRPQACARHEASGSIRKGSPPPLGQRRRRSSAVSPPLSRRCVEGGGIKGSHQFRKCLLATTLDSWDIGLRGRAGRKGGDGGRHSGGRDHRGLPGNFKKQNGVAEAFELRRQLGLTGCGQGGIVAQQFLVGGFADRSEE